MEKAKKKLQSGRKKRIIDGASYCNFANHLLDIKVAHDLTADPFEDPLETI